MSLLYQDDVALDENDSPIDGKDAGEWFGMSAAKCQAIYKEVYSQGQLLRANYIVGFEPFLKDGPLAKTGIALFSNKPYARHLPWLVSETSVSLLEAQTDSVQAGHYAVNYLTGNGASDFTMTFLEDGVGSIVTSASGIKDCMLNKDGTQKLPSQYWFWIYIDVFDRKNINGRRIKTKHLVQLQTASFDLSSKDSSVLEIQLGFTKIPLFES